jgi:hypothetical protein
LLLAYTNRFLGLASLVRSLEGSYRRSHGGNCSNSEHRNSYARGWPPRSSRAKWRAVGTTTSGGNGTETHTTHGATAAYER